MKNLLLVIYLSVICSVCLNAQISQQKLDQVELMKKFIGSWQSGNGRDTVKTWEMKEFNNAFMQVYWHTINGVGRAQNMCYYTYDKSKDSFKSFVLMPNGQLQTWHAKFTSEKEANFDRVQDLKSDVVVSRTTTIFDDNDQFTINFYNSDKVRTGTSRWVRTTPSLSLPKPDANVDQLALMQMQVGRWRSDVSEESALVSEWQRSGNVFTNTAYNVKKGEKKVMFTQNVIYSSKEGRFRSFVAYPDGNYLTYIASFNSDKKLIGTFLMDFNPGEVIHNSETNWVLGFTDPDHMIITYFTKDGTKTREFKWYKIE